MNNFTKFFLNIFMILGFGCSEPKENKLIGLWLLENVAMDKVPIDYQTTFMKIKANGSFALARTSGDLSGTYTFSKKHLSLVSEDKDWYNGSWSYVYSKNQLFLQGKDNIGRNLKLTLSKINQIPDFQEFENKVLGQWKLYKIRSQGKIERPVRTLFTIDDLHNYTIAKSDTVIERGKAVINTRHKKIIFESENMIWDAWFYGEELRLNNANPQIEYSLRKL